MRIPTIMPHAVECSCANCLVLLKLMNSTKSIQFVKQTKNALADNCRMKYLFVYSILEHGTML